MLKSWRIAAFDRRREARGGIEYVAHIGTEPHDLRGISRGSEPPAAFFVYRFGAYGAVEFFALGYRAVVHPCDDLRERIAVFVGGKHACSLRREGYRRDLRTVDVFRRMPYRIYCGIPPIRSLLGNESRAIADKLVLLVSAAENFSFFIA